VFLGAAGEVFTDGLSPQQWRVLTNRILYICRMTGLTLKDLSAPSQDAPAESRLPKPQVTDLDCKRLQILLAIARATQPDTAALLEHLQQLLETAEVVPAQDVGPDVVTMNSQALVWDEDTAGPMSLALVFPADACGSDIHRVRLSVLSQIGLALLGRRVGDVVEGAIRIDRLLYQPEAAGDFHL
jgi:regulator of nucleoside diphosphate kinase